MGLNARDLPFDVPEVMEKGFFVTKVDELMNWARTGSLWPKGAAWRKTSHVFHWLAA